jgi:predicted amidohydrolase YtcJ
VYLSDGAAFDWWLETGAASTEETDRFRVAGVKFYGDGALGSRGAALLEPYSDDPGNRGLLVTDPDTLRPRVALAVERGLQPAIHAIGDRGNRVALDAIESATGQLGSASPASWSPGRPPRIEHVQVVALEDVPRFVELGVIASFQPTHATSDMYWAEERVGPERIRGAYAWRTFRDAGARIVCGSDFPVESANPFYGIYAAVARQDQEGWPDGGWRPEERMTREEALACFTVDAARAAGMEDEVGTLSVGKRADFVIVDRDPLTAPVEDLWKTRVLRTVIEGQTVYEAEP